MNGNVGDVLGGRERRRVSGEGPPGEREEGAGPQGRPHPQRLGGC